MRLGMEDGVRRREREMEGEERVEGEEGGV